jgi:thiamine-phosphate pyrophosphorylase
MEPDAERRRRVSLILITDPRWSDDRIVQIARAIANVPGVCIQLRDRSERTDDEVLPLAQRLRSIAKMLVVNRRFDLARRVRADGVHASVAELAAASDFEWRSAPAHDPDELEGARRVATCVLVSPIFVSPGKAPPRGLDAIRSARRSAPEVLLAALGGVDARNAAECRAAGADAVAVMRALLDADDPAAVARALM